MIQEELGDQADVAESSMAGLALLDYFIDHDRAVVIDSVKTGRHPPGTIYELSPVDLDAVIAPSPHYAGLPEMLAVAERLKLNFPKEFKIFAVEVGDPYTLGGQMSQPVRDALAEIMQRVRRQLLNWQSEIIQA
jgi:hydrogenase maturation protease